MLCCGFLARDVIYTSRAYATMFVSVCLSVCVHWRIIANLGFKFRSHFITHCSRRAARRLLAGDSSRAMLASARVSCLFSGRGDAGHCVPPYWRAKVANWRNNKKHPKNVGPIRHCEPLYIAIHQVSQLSPPPLSHAACASMSTTTTTTTTATMTTTTRDRGDRYGRIEWAQKRVCMRQLRSESYVTVT